MHCSKQAAEKPPPSPTAKAGKRQGTKKPEVFTSGFAGEGTGGGQRPGQAIRGYFRAIRRRKHSTVFSIRQADRHRPHAARHGSDDRGQRFDGGVVHVAAQLARPGIAVDPHVDHHGARHAPCRPSRNVGRPIATTRMSASRVTSGQVTRAAVGDRHRSVGVEQQFRATGSPTILLRPITTASLAGDLHACSRCNIRMIPFGVQGSVQGCFSHRSATLSGWKTVHVLLAWRIAAITLILVDMLRQGQLHQNPVHAVVGIQFGDQCRATPPRRPSPPGLRIVVLRMPTSAEALALPVT